MSRDHYPIKRSDEGIIFYIICVNNIYIYQGDAADTVERVDSKDEDEY